MELVHIEFVLKHEYYFALYLQERQSLLTLSDNGFITDMSQWLIENSPVKLEIFPCY